MSMLAWLTLLGLGASSALGALQLPSGAEFVPVPALPAQPQIFDLDARGSCAVIWTDLGFLALTTDEGQTFRFVPIPQEFLQWGPRFYCADNRFFIARGADLLELLDGVWRQVGPAPGPRSATFRGVVQAPGVLYVGTGTHVLAAHDRAPTFTPVLAGVDALVTDGQAVFAAKNKEVYRVAVDEKLSLVSKLTSAVRVLAFADAALLAATDERLFRSEDGGKSWTPVPGAPPGIREISGFAGSLIVTTASGTR
ncbi:MAG: hypothetical protein ABIQ16_14730, partial [Polyangiaceae bacterium]